MLASAEAVLALRPARSHPGGIDIGVVGFHPPSHAAAYEVRAFFTDAFGGLIEDPVTGSLNASLAQWLIAERRVTAPYVAAQGAALGRRGRIHVTSDAGGQVWIGGRTETRVSGIAEI
jgi:predicted PhzF superfamily epimerase YddE/YHI9